MFSKTGSNLGVLALCEIIKHPDLSGQPNPYFVVANEDYVATRYYFIFTEEGSTSDVYGSTIKIPKIEL
jgi:hypothetical protein